MSPDNQNVEIVEKIVEPMLIAAVKITGPYNECGKGFKAIGRNFGRYICGSCFCLQYDAGYRPTDATFETCMPIRHSKEVEGISVRELPGGKCVSIIHKGPYEELGQSYQKIKDYVKSKGYSCSLPTREIYIKGPGMFFRGNPKKYITEIQFMINKIDSSETQNNSPSKAI